MQAFRVVLPIGIQGKNISDVKLYFVSKAVTGSSSVNTSALLSGMKEGFLLDSNGGEITSTISSLRAIAAANLDSTGEYNVYLAQKKASSSDGNNDDDTVSGGGGGGCETGTNVFALASLIAFVLLRKNWSQD